MIKQQMRKIINAQKYFLISSHVNPEGDSIGSQLAMAHLLRMLGKKVRIVNAEGVPHNLNFLINDQDIEIYNINHKKKLRCNAAIILDCPTLDRIGKVSSLIKNKLIINIDHHISNEKFGHINWVQGKASSTGEMVHDLFKYYRLKISCQVALFLYVAIMTDTGSFRYSNTSARTHRVISDLLKFNLEPAKIYEYIYETKTFENIKLLGEVIKNIKKDGKVVWFQVTNELLKKYGLNEEHTDDFIDIVRRIKEAQIFVFLREINSGKAVKISLRSKANFDMNKIAKYFGGGGHFLASGCVIEKKMDIAKRLILKTIKNEIKNNLDGIRRSLIS